jgi:ATP-dependent protease HslVU (ClpYQ) peptidase subunit
MTTIAAVQGEGWVVIGYDSRVSTTEPAGRIYTMPKTSGKLTKNGEYLIATAGELRTLNIISHVFKPPAVPRANTNLDKFMVSVFIPALKTCLEENMVSRDGAHGSLLMVVIRGKVYEIGEQFEWCEDTRGIYSIGSGESYALGALYASLPKNFTLENAKQSVKRAIEISAELDAGTGLPITVTVQKHKLT